MARMACADLIAGSSSRALGLSEVEGFGSLGGVGLIRVLGLYRAEAGGL